MFLRKKKAKNHTYLQIVESRWEDGKTKQRVVTTLGRLDRLQESGQLDRLVQSAARFAEVERLHLGGLLWPEAAGRLARTAYATREGLGRGQVILFSGDPGFRNWTLGTRRLLLNAIFYGPGLGTRWSNPW